MNLTSKPNLGIAIATIGALAVIGAVVAGFLAVGSPEDARGRRLDQGRLIRMQQIATAAQCAFTFTNHVPASIEEIRSSILNHREVAADYNCSRVSFEAQLDTSIAYEAEGGDHVRLCAEFNRPSDTSGDNTYTPYGLAEFPELQESRPTAGRRCYSIRLVKQVSQPSRENDSPER